MKKNHLSDVFKNSLFLIILFYSSFSWALEYYVYDHIVISQNLTVSAHHLCQDGLFIYFNSDEDCNSSSSFFACKDDLKIAPIRYVEKVYTDVGGQAVTQFFQIKTEFKYRIFSINRGAKDQLISTQSQELPFCKGREVFEPANVGSWRYAVGSNEKGIIESLNQSGHLLINTPFGQITAVKNLKIEYLFEDPTLLSLKANLKSPFCNSEVSDSTIWKMSGEYTGNGYQGFKVNTLQNLSTQLYIQRVRIEYDPILRQEKKIFDFTCTPTWSI